MRLKKSTKQFILSSILIATVFVISCNNTEKKAAETTTPTSTEVAPAATETKTNPPDTASIRPPKPPTATSPAQ